MSHKLLIQPLSGFHSPESDRWEAHVDQLLDELADARVRVRLEGQATPGCKGSPLEIVALVGANIGLLTTMAGALRRWLERGHGRGLRLAVRDATREIEVTSGSHSPTELAELLRDLLVEACPREVERPTHEPLPILFLGVNAEIDAPLTLAREAQRIWDQLRSCHGERFRLHQQWQLSPDRLAGALHQFRPAIVHFSGHGNRDGELVFVDAAGRARPAPREILGRLFGLVRVRPRCVVLNACYSDAQARSIAEHVDAVVGVSSALDDEAAIEFSAGFYESLGYGMSVAESFALALNRVEMAGSAVDDLSLHSRAGVDPSSVFLS